MKTLQTLLFTAMFCLSVHGAETNVAKSFSTYIASISVSPYAAFLHHNITDGESYGAGLELNLGLNEFVGISVINTSYSDNDWRDAAVDETGVLAKFRLVRNAQETVSLYGLAGGERNWNTDDWSLSAGLGVQLLVHKNVALFGDSRIRANFNGREDLVTRAGINLSF